MNKSTQEFKEDIRRYGWVRLLGELTSLKNAVDNYVPGQGRNGVVIKKAARDFCPQHGGKKGDKFVLFHDADDTGAGYCYKCEEAFDGFKIIMLDKGWSFAETAKEIKKIIYDGEVPVVNRQNLRPVSNQPKPLTQKQIDEANKRVDKNNDLLAESVSIHHELAAPLRLYFENRSLHNYGELAAHVRYHGAVPYWVEIDDEPTLRAEQIQFCHQYWAFQGFNQVGDTLMANMGSHPCALSIVRDVVTQKPVNIHRTYLSAEGTKIDLDALPWGWGAKKMMSSIQGVKSGPTAILLDPPGAPVIALAEGLETALAVKGTLEMPTHCTVNVGGLKKWRPSIGTELVVIFEDKDLSKAGEEGASELKQALTEMGVKCLIQTPPLPIPEGKKSVDWQDVVQQCGKQGFRPAILNWQDTFLS